MNYVQSLNSSFCDSCCAECNYEEMSDRHFGLCIVCAADLTETLEAERQEELLSDSEIVEALLADTEPRQSAERDMRRAS